MIVQDVSLTPSGTMDNSPLARLPAELRNDIYELSLTSGTGIVVVWRSEVRQWHPPPLLLTCRQIRREASSTYYAGSIFLFTCHEAPWTGKINGALVNWLRALPSPALSCIRRVRLGDFHHYPDEIAQEIKMYKELLKQEAVEMPSAEIFVLKTPESYFTPPHLWPMYEEAEADVWATA